mmetsp:Transcript_29780/g.38263  ORF Transcript_29780/g.38263 Transcript_29780/m.38263 type:complete len:87 (-) Transcript_29780:45-305(-)
MSSKSCVAIKIVVPTRLFSSAKSRKILRPISGSTLPVGSSAISRSGLLIKARAIATRCCSPPEREGVGASTRSPSPTQRSRSMTSF